jgi:hypothetical protein
MGLGVGLSPTSGVSKQTQGADFRNFGGPIEWQYRSPDFPFAS